MNEFEKIGINNEVIKAITELGYVQLTPIQQQAIPMLLKGNRDFVGLAQTGTGKTAAFGIPLLHLIDFGIKTTQALIVAPTRELCMQIANDIESYAEYMQGVKLVAVYGGASIETQITKIKKGVQIVVATPGRLCDLLRRKKVNISSIRYVVLDEADEMLNMGFREDIDSILENTPADKITWLFAATMPDEVGIIAKKYMRNPEEMTIGKKNTTAENIQHFYYVVNERDRYTALKRIVDANPDIFAIVFCRTKSETQEIAEKLIKDGYNADALHGDLSQAQRDKVMKHYRERALQLLVATDVAARGIDVNNVSHVINYQLPDETEIYTHRSGRTARAGKSGISISIINTKDVYRIRQIEKRLNLKFVYSRVPDGVEVCEQQLIALIKKIHQVKINQQGIAKFLPSVFEELKDLGKDEIITRFVSLEFNRFLEYYRNAGDLNIDFARKDHIQRSRDAGTASFFINLGEMDGFDKGSLAKYLSLVSGIPVAKFGRINLKKVYSFIDTEPELLDNIIQSFKNEIYNERKVRVDASDDSKQGIKNKDNKKDSFRNKKGKKHFDNKTFDKKAKYKKKEYRRK